MRELSGQEQRQRQNMNELSGQELMPSVLLPKPELGRSLGGPGLRDDNKRQARRSSVGLSFEADMGSLLKVNFNSDAGVLRYS